MSSKFDNKYETWAIVQCPKCSESVYWCEMNHSEWHGAMCDACFDETVHECKDLLTYRANGEAFCTHWAHEVSSPKEGRLVQ